jgi:hypothetical protein
MSQNVDGPPHGFAIGTCKLCRPCQYQAHQQMMVGMVELVEVWYPWSLILAGTKDIEYGDQAQDIAQKHCSHLASCLPGQLRRCSNLVHWHSTIGLSSHPCASVNTGARHESRVAKSVLLSKVVVLMKSNEPRQRTWPFHSNTTRIVIPMTGAPMVFTFGSWLSEVGREPGARRCVHSSRIGKRTRTTIMIPPTTECACEDARSYPTLQHDGGDYV